MHASIILLFWISGICNRKSSAGVVVGVVVGLVVLLVLVSALIRGRKGSGESVLWLTYSINSDNCVGNIEERNLK